MERDDLVVATKKIPLCEDEDDDQYTTELLVLGSCSHPSLVKLLDSFLFDDNLYVSGGGVLNQDKSVKVNFSVKVH